MRSFLLRRDKLLQEYPWLPLVLPLAVYLLVGALEPGPPKDTSSPPAGIWSYAAYPGIYTIKIVLTGAVMLWMLPGYRQFRFRVGPWALVAGTVGVVLWIGLCKLQGGSEWLGRIGLGWLVRAGARSAYNPLTELAAFPLLAWGFLAVRFLGLVVIVPIAEEFFLRGFLMRWITDPRWSEVPIGKASAAAVVMGTLLPMFWHPSGEWLAAAVWFSLITWLMIHTRSLWDCVAAHAVTNLLLGLYVVGTGAWYLM